MIREAKSHLSGLVGIMLDEALDPCACRHFWMDFYQNSAKLRRAAIRAIRVRHQLDLSSRRRGNYNVGRR